MDRLNSTQKSLKYSAITPMGSSLKKHMIKGGLGRTNAQMVQVIADILLPLLMGMQPAELI